MRAQLWLPACLCVSLLLPATASARKKPKCGPSELKDAELHIVFGTKDSLRAADNILGGCTDVQGNTRIFFLNGYLYYVAKDYNRALLGFGFGLRSPNPNKADFLQIMQRMVESRDKWNLSQEPLNRIMTLASTQIWPNDAEVAAMKKKVNPEEEQIKALEKQVSPDTQ